MTICSHTFPHTSEEEAMMGWIGEGGGASCYPAEQQPCDTHVSRDHRRVLIACDIRKAIVILKLKGIIPL